MTCLVTGASGYLGRHVLAKLEARGVEYVATSRLGAVGFKCDLTDPTAYQAMFGHLVFDATIHCAAIVPKKAEDYGDCQAAETSLAMVRMLVSRANRGVLVYASSLTAHQPTSPYAMSKRLAEGYCVTQSIIMRLPGLFGLPRRSGVIYEAALSGNIPDSFGPYPAMHVEDAAEYLVRAATMPSDGSREPFTVTYDNARLWDCYGWLGLTFAQRVEELRAQLQQEQTV